MIKTKKKNNVRGWKFTMMYMIVWIILFVLFIIHSYKIIEIYLYNSEKLETLNTNYCTL